MYITLLLGSKKNQAFQKIHSVPKNHIKIFKFRNPLKMIINFWWGYDFFYQMHSERSCFFRDFMEIDAIEMMQIFFWNVETEDFNFILNKRSFVNDVMQKNYSFTPPPSPLFRPLFTIFKIHHFVAILQRFNH